MTHRRSKEEPYILTLHFGRNEIPAKPTETLNLATRKIRRVQPTILNQTEKSVSTKVS
jgi:hypothetical protein